MTTERRAHYELYRTMFTRQWRWRLRAANGEIIANGGESYHNKQDCLDAMAIVRKSASLEIRDEER